MNAVFADLRDDGVSAPGHDVDALRQVVEQAKKDGIDLKVVVIPFNPPIEAPMRDIALDVGKEFPGSTVLTMSPSFAGSYSQQYDRFTLEAGDDLAKNGNPVQGAQNFVRELNTPHFPWTAFTIVLILLVAAAVAVTRLLQIRAKRAIPADGSADTL